MDIANKDRFPHIYGLKKLIILKILHCNTLSKKKSVVDRINEKQMRMEWDFAARELRGYTDKEIHGIYSYG